MPRATPQEINEFFFNCKGWLGRTTALTSPYWLEQFNESVSVASDTQTCFSVELFSICYRAIDSEQDLDNLITRIKSDAAMALFTALEGWAFVGKTVYVIKSQVTADNAYDPITNPEQGIITYSLQVTAHIV